MSKGFKKEKTKYPGVWFIKGKRPSGGVEKVFYIVYHKDGKLIEEPAGRQYKDDMTAARASAMREARIEGAPSNKELRAQKALEDGRYTVDRLFNYYEENRDRRKSLRFDRKRYELHIKPVLGHKIPEEVDPLSLDRFKAKLAKKKRERGKGLLSPTTIHHIMALLRQTVNFGVSRRLTKGFREALPVPPMPYNIKTEDVTDEQLQVLMDVLDKEVDQDAADVVRIAIFTPARREEILKTRWEDVDLKKGYWMMRDRKDDKDQGFKLPDEALEVFSRRDKAREDSLFVFPGPGKEGYLKDPRKAFNRIHKAAKLPKGFRLLHGQRHAYASRLVSAGVDLFLVSQLLGHKTPELTAKRYAHMRPGPLADAAQLAGRLVTDAVAKKKTVDDGVKVIG